MTEQEIRDKAHQIAGCLWEDSEGETVRERLEYCIAWRNLGTEGDLSDDDREALRSLLTAMHTWGEWRAKDRA